MKKMFSVGSAFLLLTSGLMADVALDSVFSSNMMLQREVPVAFFGKADAGTAVKVDFAGKTRSVKADANGAWRAEFPAMKADRVNYKVIVSDGKKEIVLNDVLIGDVWFCSGQSNMEMPIGRKFSYGWSARDCEKEVAAADYPEIRYVKQERFVSHMKYAPALLKGKSWVKTTPGNAWDFSATAFFFGRTLYKDLNIPIGLVSSNWGGTKIQGWISYDGYKNANLQKDLEAIEKYRMTQEEKDKFEENEWLKYRAEIKKYTEKVNFHGAEARAACAGYCKVDVDDSSWPEREYPRIDRPIIMWYRARFKLDKAAKGKDVEIFSSGKIGMFADVWVNGKHVSGYAADVAEKDKKFSTIVKAADLNQEGENVIAIRTAVYYYWDDGKMWSNIFYGTRYRVKGFAKHIVGWKSKQEFGLDKVKTKAWPPRRVEVAFKSQQYHSNLYNGMVAAWTRLPIKGVIWYQGCSNAGDLHYYKLHQALIADWRARWKQPDLPFLIVQLAGFGNPNWKLTPPNWRTTEPEEATYALIRDNQHEMIKIPNVGLATAIDIGDNQYIHPPEKQELGRRLALEAERIAYGKKIVSRGPDFAGAKIEGGSIRVSFVNADNGLKTKDGKAPGAFAIAGADKKFVWANAKIDGKTVVVSSPKIPAPKYVRYAYVTYRGDCNLQNAEGLPAYPFRSDAYDYANAE